MQNRQKRDTWKQQLLGQALAEAGISGGWRAWLVACRGQGMSASKISRTLARDMNLELEDSTLSLWIKQAERETDNGEEECTLPSGGTRVPRTQTKEGCRQR